jgi:hypothetical protein
LLKIKQSELKFYCDLLTQQTHEVKSLLLKINGMDTTMEQQLDKTSLASERIMLDNQSNASGPNSPTPATTMNAPLNRSLSASNSGYVSACSSFKSSSINTSNNPSSSDNEAASTSASAAAAAAAAASNTLQHAATTLLSSNDFVSNCSSNDQSRAPSDKEDLVIVPPLLETSSHTNRIHHLTVDDDFIKV